MSSMLKDLLELEHAGWKSLCDGTAADFYRELMTADGRMILAGGQSMSREQVVEALQFAPPWADYRIDQASCQPLSADVALLVYQGTGIRSANDTFTAVMTSVYVQHNGRWRLAHYTQTPGPDSADS